MKTKLRIGHGYDVHRLAPGLPLVVAGVKIPFEKGCVAHSDGDAAIHALCDALLGAAALGDVGSHFPDSDISYKGMDSRILLRRTAGLLAGKGYTVVNADVTVVLQAPKLRPHIDEMRRALASDMGVDVSAVSVKATTEEGLGFTGGGEGIAAHAVVLIEG